MAKIDYVNGRYVHHRDAYVHREDRGYQFADGVYEVMAFYNRRFLDEELHLKRLERSLSELSIDMPMSWAAFSLIFRELLEKNTREHGTIYIQISRGVAQRDHSFPKNVKPSVVISITGPKLPRRQEVEQGVEVITAPDIRWERCDIKALSLLPNILAKQKAVESGVREAWLVRNGKVITEGSSTNSYIVNAKGDLVTHPLNNGILGGVTRDVLLSLARKNSIKVIERPFTINEVALAVEAILTSTTSNVLSVVKVNGRKVGTGVPGPITRRLQSLYAEHIYKQTGFAWL